ncbi:MAG: class IV adenylate cyclase [Candidatus Thorarchaeota archaeon]|jgi:adenylate cyclase class 2
MSETTFEVEVKTPIGDLESIRNALERIGAQQLNSETQADAYYDHPCRAFQETDEALRLRSRLPHPQEPAVGVDESRPLYELTYKGPKVDPLSKTRIELSVGLFDISTVKSLLVYLGFRHVADMVKKRVFYSLDDFTLSLDEVEGVGDFLEIEQVVDSKGRIEPIREKMFVVLERLGLEPKTSTRESYLEMFLERNPS